MLVFMLILLSLPISGRLPVTLSHAQAAILLVLGAQRRSVEEAGESLEGLPVSQVSA